MIDTFYINLDHRVDRRESIESQLSALNIKAQRVSASVGRELIQEQKSFVNLEDFYCLMKRCISDGEIGCALSHRRIWQHIVDKNIDYTLVLEDDVIIDKRLVDLLRVDNFYCNYDFINLSSSEPYTCNVQVIDQLLDQNVRIRPKDKKTLQLWKQLEWRNKWNVFKLRSIADGLVLCECDPAPALASGYIVSQRAAKEFLHASNNLCTPIDYIWRYAVGELKQSFLSTSLIIQSENDSDILDREKVYKLTLSQKLRRRSLKKLRTDRVNDVKRMYGKI